MRLFAAAMALPVCLLTATPVYRVVDLGSLGGSSAATALNSSGLAAGWGLTASQSIQAFRSSGGGVAQALDPSTQGRAQGVNDSGQTVGVRFDAYGNAEAVSWPADGSSVSTLGGGVNSYAMAINANGAIAGAANGRAVRFTDAGPVNIAMNGAAWSSANAINSAGAVAGTAQMTNGMFRAFTAGPSGGPTATILGTLGGGASYGQAIDSAGSVAGGSTTARGYLHAFLYARGRLQDLGTLAGGNNSSAYGVNDAGQVVGYSQIAGGDSSAFLFENGHMRDLNQLIAADIGWRLSEAGAINNNGQIVGFGMKDGVQRAFRLDPIAAAFASSARVAVVQDIDAPARDVASEVPEPTALLLIAVGAAGIAIGRIRRRRDRKKKSAPYNDF